MKLNGKAASSWTVLSFLCHATPLACGEIRLRGKRRRTSTPPPPDCDEVEAAAAEAAAAARGSAACDGLGLREKGHAGPQYIMSTNPPSLHKDRPTMKREEWSFDQGES